MPKGAGIMTTILGLMIGDGNRNDTVRVADIDYMRCTVREMIGSHYSGEHCGWRGGKKAMRATMRRLAERVLRPNYPTRTHRIVLDHEFHDGSQWFATFAAVPRDSID